MTSYELWLFLHISSAIVWIGGGVVGQVFGALAKRAGDPARSAAFGQDMSFVAQKVFAPASLVLLATGALLTADGNWDWSEPFVLLGLVGWIVVAVIAFGYITREMGRAGAQMAAQGPSPELVAKVGRLVLLGRVILLVLFVLVLVMVVKPGT
jgi:uncharacterized membrane protein